MEVGAELKVPTVPLWYLVMEELGWKEGDAIYGLAELPADNPLNEYLSDGQLNDIIPSGITQTDRST